MSDTLPPIGAYWSRGTIQADGRFSGGRLEAENYVTCARCGAFVNSEERHDEWHRLVEPQPPWVAS